MWLSATHFSPYTTTWAGVQTAETPALHHNPQKRQGRWCNVRLQWADAIHQDAGSKQRATRRENKIDWRGGKVAAMIEGSALFRSFQQVSGNERKGNSGLWRVWGKQLQFMCQRMKKYNDTLTVTLQWQNSLCWLRLKGSQDTVIWAIYLWRSNPLIIHRQIKNKQIKTEAECNITCDAS